MIFFKLVAITVMLAMGWKIVTSEGMLLEKIGRWATKKVEDGNKIFDLLVCPWCTVSLQSIFAHVFAFGLEILPLEFNWHLLIRWPLIICGASFISGNLWNLYEAVNMVRERNEEQAIFYQKNNDDEK